MNKEDVRDKKKGNS